MLKLLFLFAATCQALPLKSDNPSLVNGQAISPATVTISNITSGAIVYSTAPAGANSGTLAGTASYLFVNGNSGNVGIGITNPLRIFEVSGGGYPLQSIYRTNNTLGFGSGLEFALQNSANGRSVYADMGAGITTNTNGNEDGYVFFRTVSGGSIGERARITSAGNFGVATTAPTQLLDVTTTGDSYAVSIGSPTTAGSTSLRIAGTAASKNSGGTTVGFDTLIQSFSGTSAGGNLILQGRGGNLGVGMNNGQSGGSTLEPVMLFQVGQSTPPAFGVTSAGNVGIGTTNPVYGLEVTNTNGVHLSTAANSPPGNGLYVSTNGFVGVQASNPSRALTVFSGSGSTASQLRLGFSDSFYWDIGRENVTTGRLMFNQNGTEVMSILPTSGNVGIGTVNPNTKLHLSSGTLLLDGNVTPNINMTSGTLRLWSRTKAQIDTLSAGATGEEIFCSNCNTSGDVCVSTGTGASQWHRAGSAATVGCGTGE